MRSRGVASYLVGLRLGPSTLAWCTLAGCALVGCTSSVRDVVPPLPKADLVVVPLELGPGDRYFSPQPHRDHPFAVALSADSTRAYVTMRGNEVEPGHEVVSVDVNSGEVIERIRVGSSPAGLALHPEGRFLVVANRFSPYLSIVDTDIDAEVQRMPLPYYATQVAFRADGTKMWVTNRWLDGVQTFDVRAGNELELVLREVASSRLRDRVRGMHAIPTGTNPKNIAVDEIGGHLFVANLPDLSISVIDMERDVEIDTDADATTTDPQAPAGISRIQVHAPVNDLAVVGRTLFVATLNRGSGHPSAEGPDTDGDGIPGDGTPNINFQDVQNDIATFDADTFLAGPRYTSDSLTGFFKDVPEGTAGLPSPALRIVRGSLPEQLAVLGDEDNARLAVTMSGSGEVGLYDVGAGGALGISDLFRVGFAPHGIAAARDGRTLVVANRLSEDVTIIDIVERETKRTVVGDITGGAFPATDTEIGELYNAMTGLYSADGDQSCEHCHRDSGNIRKVHGMPLQASMYGSRLIPTHRNLLRTRPLFFENSLTEDNFIPVMNEFAREENFGVGRAREDFPDRNTFFIETSQRLFGRRASFGDATDVRLLDFNGMAKMLGMFLLTETRLLPNPNPADSFAVQRGRTIFESFRTGCANCHPAPVFAASDDYNPSGLPTAMQVLSEGTYAGKNTDILASGFLDLFGGANNQFSIPSLRGMWDRPEIFYHDGRAPSLIEALATPGHPVLEPGQIGFNERDGIPDLHGGTSHLTTAQFRDLIAFIMTIE